MTRALSLSWTKHLKDETQKQNFEDLVRNSTIVLGRLREVLLEQRDELSRKELTEKDFDVPNWSERQAFRNGDRARLEKVLNLLEFIP